MSIIIDVLSHEKTGNKVISPHTLFTTNKFNFGEQGDSSLLLRERVYVDLEITYHSTIQDMLH